MTDSGWTAPAVLGGNSGTSKNHAQPLGCRGVGCAHNNAGATPPHTSVSQQHTGQPAPQTAESRHVTSPARNQPHHTPIKQPTGHVLNCASVNQKLGCHSSLLRAPTPSASLVVHAQQLTTTHNTRLQRMAAHTHSRRPARVQKTSLHAQCQHRRAVTWHGTPEQRQRQEQHA